MNKRLDAGTAAKLRAARAKHLPVSTMARAWLLDRLENEQHAS